MYAPVIDKYSKEHYEFFLRIFKILNVNLVFTAIERIYYKTIKGFYFLLHYSTLKLMTPSSQR